MLNFLRHLKTKCLLWASAHYRRLLYGLSEYEAITARAGHPQPWRARYLRHAGVRFAPRFYAGRGLWLHNGANLVLGDRCSLGEFARVLDHGPITIGDDFIAATGLQINSGTHDLATMEPRTLAVSIGHRVWCGANVTLLAGVNIGDDVVIGAGSVVINSIPSNTVAAGVPARVIRSLERTSAPTWQLPRC